MQELAQEPGVTVLEYVYDEPVRHASPEVVCQLAREVFLLRRRDHGVLADEAAAAAIAASSETLGVFAKSHPQTFANVAKADGGAEALQMLEKFARIRLEVPSEEEALVHVNRVIMERTARPATEADGLAAAAAPAPPP